MIEIIMVYWWIGTLVAIWAFIMIGLCLLITELTTHYTWFDRLMDWNIGRKTYYKIRNTNWDTTRALLRHPIRAIKRKINKKKNKGKIMRKRVLEINLQKRGFDNLITLKAVPEIEDYFKRAAGDVTEQSSKWLDGEGEGLNFYKKSEKLTGKVSGYGPVMDNFGNGLTDDGGRINLAFLRIVGISGENGVTIKTDDLLGYEETKEYIQALASWTQAFYEDNLRDQDITSTITFEV